MTHGTKSCRSGDRCQPASAREAWYCQVHHSELRLDEIARVIGISESALSQMVNPFGTGSMLPARHHAAVLQLTRDNLAVLRFYGQQQGAVVHRMPDTRVFAQVAEAVKEFGELLATVASAEDDRVMARDEADRIAREGEEVMAAIAALIADAQKRVTVVPMLARGGR